MNEYLHDTFGPSALSSTLASGTVGSALSDSPSWGSDSHTRYIHHLEASLARHTAQQSIESAAAAMLRQNEAFVPLRQGTVGRRMRSALYRSFVVQGQDENEIAAPRIAAAIGAGWMAHEWHPWERTAPNPWIGSAEILGRYVLRSYWREFGPEISRGLRQALRLH